MAEAEVDDLIAANRALSEMREELAHESRRADMEAARADDCRRALADERAAHDGTKEDYHEAVVNFARERMKVMTARVLLDSLKAEGDYNPYDALRAALADPETFATCTPTLGHSCGNCHRCMP